jgi:uncharacterized protein with GYD domain
MTTYIALFNLTEAGIKAAKDSPRRLDAAKKLLADMGGEMKQFYMVVGEFDFVGICEAPDDAVMARYVLQLGGLGFVRTKTLKAFPETACRRRHGRERCEERRSAIRWRSGPSMLCPRGARRGPWRWSQRSWRTSPSFGLAGAAASLAAASLSARDHSASTPKKPVTL